MGDRYISYYECPVCGGTVEIYDAPTCLLYVEMCHDCEYKVDLDYYETQPHYLELLSPEEARSRGIIPYDERNEEE